MFNFIITSSFFFRKWQIFFNLLSLQFLHFYYKFLLIPPFLVSNAFKLALAKLEYIVFGQATFQFSVHVSGTLVEFVTPRKLKYVAHVTF